MQAVIATSQEEADTLVTEKCDCDGSDKIKKIIHMDKLIDAICGEESKKQKFVALSTEEIEEIKSLGRMVLNLEFTQAQLRIPDSVITMSGSSKGIKISRSRKEVIEAEA